MKDQESSNSKDTILNNNNPIDWNDLFRRAQNNDEAATRELFKALQVRLSPLLQHILRGRPLQDQEDILQETLFVTFKKLKQIHTDPLAYAHQTLRYKIGDYLRDPHQFRTIALEHDDRDDFVNKVLIQAQNQPPVSGTDPDFVTTVEKQDLLERIKFAIMELSGFCQAFFAGILENRSIQEIWGLLRKLEPDLKRSAFDKRIFDCRKRLKIIMSERS